MLIVENGATLLRASLAALENAHQHLCRVKKMVTVRVSPLQNVQIMSASPVLKTSTAADLLIHHYVFQEHALNAKTMETAPVLHLDVFLTIVNDAHQTMTVLAFLQPNSATTSQMVLAESVAMTHTVPLKQQLDASQAFVFPVQTTCNALVFLLLHCAATLQEEHVFSV